MRKLFQFKEAAEKFYGGDEESLRHALLLGVVRARIELCNDEGTYLWSLDCDPEGVPLPDSDHNELAKWHRVGTSPSYRLTGWFYVAADQASKIAHGKKPPHLYVSPDEEEEFFLGLYFFIDRACDLGDLWFEPSQFPQRVLDPGDEVLDYMAGTIGQLTDDRGVIARFAVAANSGVNGIGSDELMHLQQDFHARQLRAVVGAAVAGKEAEFRQLHAKGGRRPRPTDKMKSDIKAEWQKWNTDRRGQRPSDFVRDMCLKFKDANHGTLKNWMRGWASGN